MFPPAALQRCVSRTTARRSSGHQQAFTLTEVLISVGIIAILATVLIPSAGGLVRKAEVAKCTANLRAIGVATLSYAAENNNRLPEAPPFSWRTYRWDGWYVMKALRPYAPDLRIFFCPGNDAVLYKNMPDAGVLDWSNPPSGWNVQWTYQASFRGEPLTSFSSKGAGDGVGSETPIVWDAAYPGWGDGVSDCNHRDKTKCIGANWLFADGHIIWATSASDSRWPNYGQ